MTKTDHISDQGPMLWTNLIAQYKKIRNSYLHIFKNRMRMTNLSFQRQLSNRLFFSM